MDSRLREVAAVLEAVETVHLAALAGLGPLAERVRDAQVRAARAAGAGRSGRHGAHRVAPRRRPARHLHDDPLSLPAGCHATCAAADGSDGDLDAIEACLAERRRPGRWPADRTAADAGRGLDPLYDREARARREALDRVAAQACRPPDPGRRCARGWPRCPRSDPTREPSRRCPPRRGRRARRETVRTPPRAATADRPPAELAGRFAAYRAKALRLGVSDDPEVTALAAQVRDLLASHDRPACSSPALVAYQQRVNEREEGRPA
jgi:hypothetical protein